MPDGGVKVVAALAVVGCALAAGGCASTVRSHIYLPAPMPASTPWVGHAPEQVTTTTADGVELRGYYWPPREPGGDLLVYFHGQSGNRYLAASRAAPLASRGGLLVASYRGYGDNAGEASEAGLYADALAFVALAKRLAPASRIYLLGYSLGAAPALHAAASPAVSGVVTFAAFTRLVDVAPWYATGFLPDAFDNTRNIAAVRVPILLLHGTLDDVVPVEHAQVLRDHAPRGARLLRIDGAGHGADFEALARIVWDNVRQMPR